MLVRMGETLRWRHKMISTFLFQLFVLTCFDNAIGSTTSSNKYTTGDDYQIVTPKIHSPNKVELATVASSVPFLLPLFFLSQEQACSDTDYPDIKLYFAPET